MAMPLILDCDPGHDDAIAILLAHANPAVELLAITTVAGNQDLAKTTLNARRVCTAAGITGVPIAAGAAGPLLGELLVAEDIHGDSGLDGPDFGEPTVPLLDESAVDLMRRVLTGSDRPVALVATGPLTNVALLLQRHPEVKDRIAEVILMGGSTERGNTTAYAEFNIYVDPEAAEVVLAAGVPVTVIGLNVTHQALVTPQVLERIAAIGTPLAGICVDLMTYFAGTYLSVFGMAQPPLHDPVAVARLIDPAVVTCVPAPVQVETVGRYTRGATVVDLHHRSGMPDNALVGVELDRERFWDLVVDAIRACESLHQRNSPSAAPDLTSNA
jgi:purine nucleosidase/pyrimidine-specific ribonucleoside hydrolase